MTPRWRELVVGTGATILAIWLAFELADGSWLWPILAGTIALGAILVRTLAVPLNVIAIGVLLIGYMVGNRGFAQLMIVPGLPLLPAEIGLVIAAAWLVVRAGLTKTLPWRRNSLNFALAAWMALGVVRFAFDLPQFGFLAVRDFATVYYVAFFFITQEIGRDEKCRRFLIGCLLAASITLPVVYALVEVFPEFFLSALVVRGVPLIYFKGDLAPTFIGVSAIILYITVRGVNRWWARPMAMTMVLWVCVGENRASLLGLVVGLGWMLFSRYRSLVIAQAAVAVAVIVLAIVASLGGNEWAQKKFNGVADRVMSVVDFTGNVSYHMEESSSKSANNQFRWVWWRTVASETFSRNPAFGLGFGYDLARGFLQEYNPDLAEEFTARSPHSILMTALGRLGLVGLLVFLWILAALAFNTWRTMRDPASDVLSVALWASVWPIAISACLGVVLEGPMGAVVFWSLLGLAQSQTASRTENPVPVATEDRRTESPDLISAASSSSVGSIS